MFKPGEDLMRNWSSWQESTNMRLEHKDLRNYLTASRRTPTGYWIFGIQPRWAGLRNYSNEHLNLYTKEIICYEKNIIIILKLIGNCIINIL